MEVHDTISILAVRDGKVLLVKRLNRTWYGMWSIPGGHVDGGESPREAAVREASEEVDGIEVTEGPEPVFVHDVPAGEKRCPEPHRHKCHNFMGAERRPVTTGSDAGEHAWVSPEKALSMDITDWARTVLDWYLQKAG